MQSLEGTVGLIPKPYGQPIEQLRVGRRGAHATKVVGSIDQTAAKMVEPDPIDDGAPG